MLGNRLCPTPPLFWPQKASSAGVSPSTAPSWAGKCPLPPWFSARPPAAGCARSHIISTASQAHTPSIGCSRIGVPRGGASSSSSSSCPSAVVSCVRPPAVGALRGAVSSPRTSSVEAFQFCGDAPTARLLPYRFVASCVARARSGPLATASRAHARTHPRLWPLAEAPQALAFRLSGSRAASCLLHTRLPGLGCHCQR